jgi:hypothetical protein
MDEIAMVRKSDGSLLLSPAQAARWLHRTGKTAQVVYHQTLVRWARTGLLPCVRWGRGRGGGCWFAVADLEAFEPQTPGGRRGRPRKEQKQCGN